VDLPLFWETLSPADGFLWHSVLLSLFSLVSGELDGKPAFFFGDVETPFQKVSVPF